MIGNGGVALGCHALVRRIGVREQGPSRDGLLWVLIWRDAFSTFNVWSYMPLRTLTTHADMATLARGLGISMWTLLPFACAVGGFFVWRFCRVALPLVQSALYPDDPRTVMGAGLLGICFAFFSMGGLSGAYGPYGAIMDVVSAFAAFPWALIMLADRSSATPARSR